MKEENELLKCPICFDLFHTALLLPCSHNFCALCIRQSLTFGHKRCPICKKPSDTCDLRPNRLIDELVAHYLGTKEIKKGLKGYSVDKVEIRNRNASKNSQQYTISKPFCRSILDTSEEALDDPCREPSKIRPSSLSKPSMQPILTGVIDLTLASPPFGVNQGEDKSLSEKTVALSIKSKPAEPNPNPISKKRKRNDNSNIKPKKSKSTNTRKKPKLTVAAMFSRSKAPEKVQCPVCKIPILKGKINTHLDQCLATSSGRETFHEANQHLQWKLPNSPPRREKYKAYSHMTTEEIKSLLKSTHLPSNSDRKKLIKLHQEFVILQNASCDSLKPIPGRQIARDMVLKKDRERMQSLFKRKPKAPSLAKKEQLFSELLKKAKKRRKALRRKRKNLSSATPDEQITTKQVIESYLPENRTVSDLPPYWEAVWNDKLGKVEYSNIKTSLKTTDRDLVYKSESIHQVETKT